MNLNEHYKELYKKSSEAILSKNYVLDQQINDASDSRFGITLLIRPSEKIKSEINLLLNELKEVDSDQYFYPDSDIHITVLSIISCHEGFDLNQISPHDYIEIICKSLVDIDKIKIAFRGVTASSSAVMIQGFPLDDSIDILRNKLRENFQNTNLKQSIDSRYTISTAHSTIMRFKENLKDPEKLIAVTEKFRDYDFGEFTVENLELVYNDWYQRAENTKVLGEFRL
ncbi:2'-5' RNA ligase family protein [Flavobacterium reichenbachii]|uniref:Mutarotase n=1 Tax=Flavobacterium reichenbachii TaxID=362418 RepID=A0A085ZLZ0_9FLAO|nr:mutarotase [Flavobacterium reichenbachii]KFF05454.1 mutarotase [Flavobacterium reichenbachii]OXB17794.1 mutarotase [Flavobacterium reichenbachii]